MFFCSVSIFSAGFPLNCFLFFRLNCFLRVTVFHVFGLEIWHIKTEALKAEPLYRMFVFWLGMVDARSAMSQNFRVAWLLHFTNVKIWMKRFLCEPLPVMCKTFHKSSSFQQPCTCMSNRNN